LGAEVREEKENNTLSGTKSRSFEFFIPDKVQL
jgi:hypothetical protein